MRGFAARELEERNHLTTDTAILRNWRDSESYLGHDSAIVWPLFLRVNEDDPAPHHCLTHLSAFAGHSLQGGKSTDYHSHQDAEQYYYILAGETQVRIEDDMFPVHEGSVTYFPPGVKHQLVGDDCRDWMQYLIISCPVDVDAADADVVDVQQSKPRVLNWREAQPALGNHGKAVTWLLLERLGVEQPATDQPCLLAFHYLARQALGRGQASDMHQHDDKEQIYYVTEGEGVVVTEHQAHRVREGDAVYLPRSVPHMILNDAWDGWLSYLVVS
jgi:quercetin dioxygenase-like cupin family protein